jgi:hypothetical protein
MFSTLLLLLAAAHADDSALHAGADLDCNDNGVVDTCEALNLSCTNKGVNGWVEYRTGTLPIILSVPHGGADKSDLIAERTDGTTGSDMLTIETAEAIDDALFAATGRRAHVVISNLHRSRLDPNRDLEDAVEEAGGLGEQVWTEYHNAVEAAHAAVMASHGGGLYVDLHGLSASRTKTEFAYLLTGSDLLDSDSVTGHPAYAMRSSLATMGGFAPDFMELIRGESGLGGLMDAAGHAVVPSPTYPDPGVDDAGHAHHYFNGGYSTRRHGSYYGGHIDGIQIEHMWEGVRDSGANRTKWGKDLAAALIEFTGTHGTPTDGYPTLLFPLDLPLDTCPVTEAPATDAWLFDDFGRLPFESLDDLGPMSFDGEDDVVVAYDRDLGEDFTVSFSFRTPEYTGHTGRYQYLYSHGTYSWRGHVAVFISPWGKISTTVRGADESHSYWAVNPNIKVMDGEVHTYALTIDTSGETPVTKVYLDGELVAEDERGHGGVTPKSGIHLGGREDLASTRFFQGELADFQLTSGALDAAAVASLPVTLW